MTAPQLLFVTRHLPEPSTGGHAAYSRAVLDGLSSAGFEVSLACLRDASSRVSPVWRLPEDIDTYKRTYILDHVVHKGVAYPTSLDVHWFLRRLAGAWDRIPARTKRAVDAIAQPLRRRAGRRISFLRPPDEEEREFVRRVAGAARPDVVLVNQTSLTPLLREVAVGVTRAVLTHDVLHERDERLRRDGATLGWRQWTPERERELLLEADVVVAIQPDEGQTLRRLVPERDVVVAPMGLRPMPASRSRGDAPLLFVGSRDGVHNVDGLLWFLSACWPQIRVARPDARLDVVGTVCEAVDHAPPGVALRGKVPDLEPHYRGCSLAIAPLRFGSGLKVKIIEAFSHGRAVVSTSAGLQGIDGAADRAALLADDAANFAACVVRALSDDALRHRLEAGAIELVERRYAPTSAFESLVSRLAPARSS